MTLIDIIDVTARDGLQNEQRIVSTADKLTLITDLIGIGATRLEAASFVHPDRVPTMADAEAVMARVPRVKGVSYIGLALNRRGVLRALGAEVDEINFVLPVTDAFARANQGTSVDRLIEDLRSSAADIAASGVSLTVTLAVAFGCPYAGAVDSETVRVVAQRALEAAEVHELAIADTIGSGVPRMVRDVISALRPLTSSPLRMHFHETRHTAVANSLAAIDAGVTRLDSSVGGLGGCPFAPGAAGNVSTEDLAWALREEGHETSIDIEGATTLGRWISDLVGVRPRSGLASAGAFPESAPGA